MSKKVRVWDLPTRVFHWALVLCVVGLLVTGYLGGANMQWHARLGYAVLALLLFRVVWGFVGGRWSRFTSFIYSPGSVIACLRGQTNPDHSVGHSPLGGLSVFAMLLALLAQVATGLVGDDEISFTGPLNRFVDTSSGLAATAYHTEIGQWLIIGLAALHVSAIFYYLVLKKYNLIRPMVHGDKPVGLSVAPSRDDAPARLVALGVLAACAGFVSWLVNLSG